MPDSSARREEEIRSALERLPLAVVVVEGGTNLRPYNRKGIEFFEREALTGDVLKARPSHPLSRFIRTVLEASSPLPEQPVVVEMPSGNIYRIELSRRSEKGRSRLLMLLVQPHSGAAARSSFDRWQFTARERDVVQQLLDGASSGQICKAMGISTETLKSHIASVLAKTGCRNRTELVAKLLREG